ncbi:MAG: hypothetical protein NT013_13755 [Planctomycetia bacterium]|nr:hypothetical protein [Planctomycetia bacterium]
MTQHIARLICRMNRTLNVTALLVVAHLAGPLAQTVQACPMCKIANEQDALLPKAYMYSILFMMGMMFSLAGGVAFAMYRIGRRENADLENLEQFGLGVAAQGAS